MKRFLSVLMVLALLVANVPPVTVNAVAEGEVYRELREITVKTPPHKTEYMMGEELDTTGLVLTAHYSDGSTEDITEGFETEWFDSWMSGPRSVHVYYEGMMTSFEATVVAPMELIVKTLPEKLTYYRDESLDTKGMVLTVVYSNGTTKDITDGFYIDYFESYSPGIKTVNVSYEGMTTYFEVTVINGGIFGDNLTWVLDEGTGVLTISGNGSMGEYNNPWLSWNYSIHSVVIENGVTNIGAHAFENCSNLTQISIPGSVTSIGSYAFNGCNSLSRIDIPNGVLNIDSGAFAYCGISEIEIPDSVTYIGDEAFRSCHNLTQIVLPKDLTSIGWYTFSDCQNLGSVTIPASVTSIGDSAFYDCGSLSTVYYLGYEESRSNLTVSYGNEALENARWVYQAEGVVRTGITVETMPQKTEYWVFEELNSTGLSITVNYSDGAGITIFEGFTVSGFDSSTAGTKTVTVTYKDLTTTFTVTVKAKAGACGENLTWELDENGVLTISGTGAMENWGNGIMAPWYQWAEGITKLEIADGVTSLGAFAFYGFSALPEVQIPDSVSVLSEYAFSGCRTLTNVIIPKDVTSIGTCAFSGCTSLTEITIPDGITELSYGIFEYCPWLTEITLPAGITSIGDYAFSSCSSLRTVNFKGDQKQKAQITVGQYNDFVLSATWNYEAQDGVTLTNVSIKSLPAKIKFVNGEELDTAGLVLAATYSDGDTLDITCGFTVSGYDSWTAGVQQITVVYEGVALYFDVTVINGGTCGENLNWELDEGTGVLTISGNGALYDYDHPWDRWSYSITSIVIEEGVTYIGFYCFSGCENLTQITLPSTLTEIRDSAFDNCYNLSTVNYRGTRAQKSNITIGEYNAYLADATWYCAAVAMYEQDNTQTRYESLEEALTQATGGTVTLLMDVTAGTVAVKPGVTLDLNGYTLSADLVVGMNGAVITDGGEACAGGGCIKTEKYALVYAPSQGLQSIPVWNGADGYIFTKVTFLQMTQATGVEGTARYIFLPRFSNSEAAALLSDGGTDNGLKIKVCMTWADGKSQQLYTYGDDLVAKVYDGTGSLAFDLTISGIAGITDMVVNAQIVTDSGAIATCEGKTV